MNSKPLPRTRLARFCGHTFVETFISSRSIIVDLGMNKGEFARAIESRFPGVKVYGCEPVPSLFDKLQASFNERILNVAVGGDTRLGQLHLYKGLCASVTLAGLEPDATTQSVRILSLDDLFNAFGLQRVDLLKVDIEGAELGMILQASETSLKYCDQLSVEFHDFMDRSQLSDVRACIRRLRSFGFHAFRCSILNHSDMLFVHERRLKDWRSTLGILLGIIRNDFTLGKVRNFFLYIWNKSIKRSRILRPRGINN